eukprot:3139009-Rhodomonas_salina.4
MCIRDSQRSLLDARRCSPAPLLSVTKAHLSQYRTLRQYRAQDKAMIKSVLGMAEHVRRVPDIAEHKRAQRPRSFKRLRV